MKLFLWLFPVFSFAQNWVEVQSYSNQQTTTVRLDGLFTKAVDGKWGGFTWFQAEQVYSQVYAGVTYKPKPWLQLAFGAGAEQDKNPLRLGTYAYFGKGKVSSLAVFETGGSGFWYKVETNYKTKSGLGFGLMSNRYRGHGPRAEYNIPNSRALLWFSPLYSRGVVSLTFGLRWKL